MANNKIDEQFADLVVKIESLSHNFNKHHRIRIEQWLKKLSGIVSNDIWKRNRNNYARLLLSCLHHQNLIEPFTKMPPQQASLTHLKDHQIKQLNMLISKDDKPVPSGSAAQQPRQMTIPNNTTDNNYASRKDQDIIERTPGNQADRTQKLQHSSLTKDHKPQINCFIENKKPLGIHNMNNNSAHKRIFEQEGSSIDRAYLADNLYVNKYRSRIAELEQDNAKMSLLLLRVNDFMEKYKEELYQDPEYQLITKNLRLMHRIQGSPTKNQKPSSAHKTHNSGSVHRQYLHVHSSGQHEMQVPMFMSKQDQQEEEYQGYEVYDEQ